MAERRQGAPPPAPASGHPRSDHESLSEKEEKRKKRMKWAAYIAAFSVFQVIVILVFVLVIMRVRRPRFRIGQFAIDDVQISSNQSSPGFNLSFTAPIRVKNTNFGPYKYDATTVTFMYGGSPIGTADVPKSKANFKSTKKIDLKVNLTSTAAVTDLNSGNLTITSYGKMNGKVEFMFILKKKKATEMNCTMMINAQAKKVQDVNCK